MTTTPDKIILRSYQVGFGDCFLLTFHYPNDEERHVLIDFGSTEMPDGTPDDQMLKVAQDIKGRCGNHGLEIVVATHRHRDHVSGFTTGEKGTGEIIRELTPKVVIQPWTEDPEARDPEKKLAAANHVSPLTSFVSALIDMHGVAEMVVAEAERLNLQEESLGLQLNQRVYGQLRFIGDDNKLPNRSAVENLMEMGRKGKPLYVSYQEEPLNLTEELPGVKVWVLGPPTLDQHKEIRRYAKTSSEYWQFQFNTGQLVSTLVRDENALFQEAETFDDFVPPHMRWFIRRMQATRGDQLLDLVRALDSVMNNTSVILLFEIGDKKLLFPGDAQVENWEFALSHKWVQDLIKDVTLFKVGHHGSLNANPKKMLWGQFDNRGKKQDDPQHLYTVVSTMAGKHGHMESGTEVPRTTLVNELKAKSEYHTTQTLAQENKLFEDIEIMI